MFAATFLATISGVLPPVDRVSRWLSSGDPGSYPSTYRLPVADQNELVMLYFGQAACGWSNVESLPDAVERIKSQLRAKARAHGWSFRTVGVALDWSVEAGLKHLEKFGRFDELSVGYNWTNSQAMKYLSGEFVGQPATPQVVVVKRTIRVQTLPDKTRFYSADGEEVIVRKVGTTEIEAWGKDQAPLPEVTRKLDATTPEDSEQ